jgi:hypothetical protein
MDDSDYRDSDVEATSGTDQFASHDDDTDGFGTFDKAKVTITSTAPAGAVTTVSVTDTSSDIGTTQAQDENDDTETLPTVVAGLPTAPTTGESDNFTFDDATGEQDTARDNETIGVTVQGYVLPGDFVDSTETITLGGKETTTDNTDDPGTESDTPTGDGEQDKFTDHSHADANLNLEDILVSREKKTQSNPSDSSLPGTYIESQTIIDFTDAITAQEGDSFSDQHGAKSGAQAVSFAGSDTPTNEVDTDHETTDDNSSVGDKSADTIQANSVTITPVTNGQLITTDNSTTFAEDFTGDTSDNNDTLDDQGPPDGPFTSEGETDKTSDDLSDQGFGDTIGGGASMLILKDPTTGVTTNILSGQQGLANFNDQASDDTSVGDTFGLGTGNALTSTEDDRLAASAGDSSQGPLDISIVGSPAPGITADFEATLILGSYDGAQIQGEDDSQAAGSDSGNVKFGATELATAGGKLSTTIGGATNADDGHGNTANSATTITTKGTVGSMGGEGDRGEVNFADTNGQPTSDNESDTDVQVDEVQASTKQTLNMHLAGAVVDPATGWKTTVSADNNDSTDNVSELDSADAIDRHSSTLADAVGTDAVSGESDVETDEEIADHVKFQLRTQGMYSAGKNQVDLLETSSVDDSGSNDLSDDAKHAADATGTDVAHLHSFKKSLMTDFIKGSIAAIDPTTGIKTTTYVTDLLGATGNDTKDANETLVSPPGGLSIDTASTSDVGTDTVNWNIRTTVVQTNADGTSAATPTTISRAGNDTENQVNGATTDQGGSAGSGPTGAPPAIAGVAAGGDTAAQGATTGGSAVVITGTGFDSASQVAFGGIAAQSTIVISPTMILAIAPPHALGTVHVSVSNAAGTSPVTPADQFTFQAGADPNDGGPPGAPPAQEAPANPDATIPAAVRAAFDLLYGEHGQKLLTAFHNAGGSVQMVSWLWWGWFGRKSDFDWLAGGGMQIEIQQDVDPVTAATLLMEHLAGDALGSMTKQLQDLNALIEAGSGSGAAFDGNWDLYIASVKASVAEGGKFASQIANLYVSGVVGWSLGGTLANITYDTFTGNFVAAGLGAFSIFLIGKLAKGGAAAKNSISGLVLQFGKEEVIITREAAETFAKLSAAERRALLESLKSTKSATEAQAILAALDPTSEIHHIVTTYENAARGWERNWAQESQKILDRAAVGLESKANKLLLPGHNGPHPELYHKRVFERLRDAARNKTGQALNDAVTKELEQIRADLLADPSRLSGIGL